MQKKFKNMKTPFWYFVQGIIMLVEGIVMIITLGFYHPDWYGDFLAWKLKEMFKEKI